MEWIKIKNKQPDNYQKVDLYRNGERAADLYYVPADNTWPAHWTQHIGIRMLDVDPNDYWMPLPPPPKEGE